MKALLATILLLARPLNLHANVEQSSFTKACLATSLPPIYIVGSIRLIDGGEYNTCARYLDLPVINPKSSMACEYNFGYPIVFSDTPGYIKLPTDEHISKCKGE